MKGQDAGKEVQVYEWLRDRMARASIQALCGKVVLEVNPDFIGDFGEFDKVFLKLGYGIPKFAFPKGYEARDRILQARPEVAR